MNRLPVEEATELEGRTFPSYVKVRNWLLDFIAEQKLQTGDRMPSERELAVSMGLSRTTVAKAVAALVEQRILMRQQRSGTFVGDRAGARRKAGTHTVGIMMPWLEEGVSGYITKVVEHNLPGLTFWRECLYVDIMHGAVSVLNEFGYRFLIMANNTREMEDRILAELLHEELDGVLVLPYDPTRNESIFAGIARNGLPMVFADRYCEAVETDWVATDNIGSARDAVLHMVSRGHRRIAFLTDFNTMTSVIDRLEGYKAGLEEAGIPYDEDIVCGPEIARHGNWRLHHAIEHCLHVPDPATAFFCMNEVAVLGALNAADALGYRLPRDFEMIGFFDDQCSANIRAQFIGVKQDTIQMGKIAAQMLVDRISGTAPEEPRHVLLPAKIEMG